MRRPPPPPLPFQIGPTEFSEAGRLVAVRCPRELAHILRRAGAIWEPDTGRWLVRRSRIASVVRALEAASDPLFRRVGISLD
jgi:hypothetical protein